MSERFERDLKQLQRHILARASFVEGAVEKAIESLQKRDVDLAKQVLSGDSLLDHANEYLEDECVKLLALHQPVPATHYRRHED